MRRAASLVAWVAATLMAAAPLGAQPSADARVAAAEQLVARLDLANTDYEHGRGSVTWDGTVASHTDCSGFIDHLLMRVDGYSTDDFRRWFGKGRPTADRYHDAIAEGRGFIAVRSIRELRPGDLVAIKYLSRRDNTGHVMLVVEPPRRISPNEPMVDGTTQWAITVIDSSETGHGATDTRHHRGADGRDHDGLGRGVFRLYGDARDEVAGFAWSTLKVSRFIAPAEEHVVLGRFQPGFRP